MRVTQGAFSFLPDLTDEEIQALATYVQGLYSAHDEVAASR